MKPRRNDNSRGYVLVGALILLALSAIVIATSLHSTGTTTRNTGAARARSEKFFSAEEAMNLTVNWFRENSTSLALPFSRTNFYSLFQRTSPSVGDNEGTFFNVPTRVKLRDTSSSAVLTNEAELATAAFPNTKDAATGGDFNPSTTFAAAQFGDLKVRATLVDAVAIDPSKDYGDPAVGNPPPDTDFQPVYRLDSMSAVDMGAHLLGYLKATLVFDYGIGFYGRDFVEFRQDCDSYRSNSGPYNSGTKRANCTAGSNGVIRIHGQEVVYGKARTNGLINGAPPYGGLVCADFLSGCPNPGQTCQGASCNVPGLPTYSPWLTYCPSNQGDRNVNASTTISVPGNDPMQKCWNSMNIGNNKVLTLNTTTYPYFIDTFNIPNNSRVNFAPSPGTGTINLYVRTFAGNKFNGNQVFNLNNKPYQLRIHYLGTNALTMDGTAAMNAFLIAPYAAVTVSGNFTYSGGIKATSLTMTGSGDVHYDESGDITTISDTTYRLTNMEERYR